MRGPSLAHRLSPRLSDELTARQQEVYDLRSAGWTFAAIATKLQISKPSAWQHYRYARTKVMQRILRQQGWLNGRGP